MGRRDSTTITIFCPVCILKKYWYRPEGPIWTCSIPLWFSPEWAQHPSRGLCSVTTQNSNSLSEISRSASGVTPPPSKSPSIPTQGLLGSHPWRPRGDLTGPSNPRNWSCLVAKGTICDSFWAIASTDDLVPSDCGPSPSLHGAGLQYLKQRCSMPVSRGPGIIGPVQSSFRWIPVMCTGALGQTSVIYAIVKTFTAMCSSLPRPFSQSLVSNSGPVTALCPTLGPRAAGLTR